MTIRGYLTAIGTAFLDSLKSVRVQASIEAGDERQYEDASWFAGLGVTGMPYPNSEDGFVEGVVLDGVGPYAGIVVAARDRRATSVYGELAPGDTCVHTTGPGAITKLLLKREQKIAALLTKDKWNKDVGIILDGDDETLTITWCGNMIQLTRDNGIVMSSASGNAGITISGDTVHIRGNVMAAGLTPPPGLAVMLGPVIGQEAGAAVKLVPAQGFSVGI